MLNILLFTMTPENKKHKYIYRWKGRFDGTLELLYERYRKHHNHQNWHKPEEIKLILDMRKLNSHNEPAIFWIKLKHREYSCTITCLYHFFVSRDFRLLSLPIKSIFISLMDRWSIRDSASSLMLNSYLQYVLLTRLTVTRK